MVDWVGSDGLATSARFRDMAERQLPGLSPSYQRLCLGVAGDPELCRLLDTLPRPKRQPNLLLAAARYLDAPMSAYEPFAAFVRSRWPDLSTTMLARRTQTNEPRRCSTLLPALAGLPQPLALLEVGASAGLCLLPDRYAYRYDDGEVLGDSPVVLDCATTGQVPVPRELPTVVWRAGLDLNPLDVRSADDVRWLQSLVWPEQTERFATLRGALELARDDPPPIHRGDLTVDFEALADSAPRSATLVVFHSAVMAYLDGEQRAHFRAAVERVRARRRIVWLSNEGPGVIVDHPAGSGAVPFVLSRDDRVLAEASPHGLWLRWLESAPARE